MVKIEKKTINNKDFFYLNEQLRIDGKYKKIQVYIGKNIPKDLSNYYVSLKNKEIDFFKNNIEVYYKYNNFFDISEYEKIELTRINWKYYILVLNKKQLDKMYNSFSVKFIFESNAIEGSRISVDDVERIIKNKYVKKTVIRKEIIEVENSIKLFKIIREDNFKLNQRSIINLHKKLILNLDIESGYKKNEIIVNNKKTVPVGCVRHEMAELLTWWNIMRKENVHPLLLAIEFHQKFEYIHPFEDGNGRIGRLILNWMFLKAGYGFILIKNKNRQSYFSALDQADNGRLKKLYRFCLKNYKNTIDNITIN